MDNVISSLSSLPSVGTTAPAPSKALGKDEFLRLLTTQLQHQDPLSPMDSEAFIAQLAQFAGVEQLQAIGSRLDTLLLASTSSSQLAVSSLLGRDVLYRSDRIGLTAGTPATVQVQLDGAADDATAIITDANGAIVRTLPLGARGAGSFSLTWDGLDGAGSPLPSGDYVVTVAATRKDGAEVSATVAARGRVRGVTFEDQNPRLLVGADTVALSDVVDVYQPTTSP